LDILAGSVYLNNPDFHCGKHDGLLGQKFRTLIYAADTLTDQFPNEDQATNVHLWSHYFSSSCDIYICHHPVLKDRNGAKSGILYDI